MKRKATVDELNPNHEVTQFMRDQWHKIVALIMLKHGVTEVRIESDDVAKLLNYPGEPAVVCDSKPDHIMVRLVMMEEAQRLARGAGGLLV